MGNLRRIIMGSQNNESVENAVGVKVIIAFIVGIICLMVGSDVFHVHSEHEFDLHSEEWIKKIKAKELEMIAWQQANLDTIIPGIIDPESSDESQNMTELLSDSWTASSFSAVNTELTSMLPSIGNLTVHQSHLCRLECIMNTACGSWSQYQDSCTLYPITLTFDTSPLENATSGIE